MSLDNVYTLRRLLRLASFAAAVVLSAGFVLFDWYSSSASIASRAQLAARAVDAVVVARRDHGEDWPTIAIDLQDIVMAITDDHSSVQVHHAGALVAQSGAAVQSPRFTLEIPMQSSDLTGLKLVYIGSLRPVLVDSFVVIAGLLLGVLGVVFATERLVFERWLRAEHSRRLLQIRMSDIAEASSDWFWEMNTSFRLTLCTGAEGTPFEAQYALGKRLWDIGSLDIRGSWHRLREDLEEHRPFRVRISTDVAGRNMWYELRGLPFRDDTGAWAGYRGAAHDVSVEELQAHQLQEHRDELARQVEEQTSELRQAIQRAEAANDSKTVFLANMSHEIRTPMSSILGLTQIALANDMPDKLRTYLEKIQRSGKHLIEIVNDILDLSKIEAGKIEIKPEPIRLRDAVQESLQMVRARADEKGLSLQLGIDDEVPVSVLCDGVRLRQVLLNLLGNAVKFTDAGYVQLSVRLDERAADAVLLQFSVSDSGVGIEPSVRSSLFNDYQQADSTIEKRFGGTGLGLSISRRLVELMGGVIDVESVPGKGSRFWFRLPLQVCDGIELEEDLAIESEQVRRELPEDVSPGRVIRVLLVEDNAFNQEVTSQILSDAGIDVDIACNGLEAVERVSESASDAYDVILMDFSMPVMDGIEASRRIKQLPGWSSVPIIALTANVMQRDRDSYAAAGMCDFVAKPTDYELLVRLTRFWAARGSDLPSLQPDHPDGADEAHLPGSVTCAGPAAAELAVLDASVGLARCMSRQDVYERMLRSLLRTEADVCTRLDTAVSEQRLGDVGRIGHSLKGVTGQLGAMRANAAALSLDVAYKAFTAQAQSHGSDAGSKQRLMAAVDPLKREMEALLATIRAQLEDGEPQDDGRRDASANGPAVLHGLLTLVEQGEADALPYLRQNQDILRATMGPQAESLFDALESYNFDSAVELLRAFLDRSV